MRVLHKWYLAGDGYLTGIGFPAPPSLSFIPLLPRSQSPSYSVYLVLQLKSSIFRLVSCLNRVPTTVCGYSPSVSSSWLEFDANGFKADLKCQMEAVSVACRLSRFCGISCAKYRRRRSSRKCHFPASTSILLVERAREGASMDTLVSDLGAYVNFFQDHCAHAGSP